MDQLDVAIQQTALNAEGGATGLARKMGVNPQTLINKCNPNSENHKLTLREAIAMMLNTGDFQILQVMAADLGHSVDPLIASGKKDLMTAVLSAVAEHADVGRAVLESVVDKRLTPREEAKIRTQVTEAKRALDELLETVKAYGKIGRG